MGADSLLNRTPNTHVSASPAEFEIRRQIERILNSKAFTGSERLRRFLRWTAEQTLLGKTENIKQYTIGREVFDRGAEFDPRIDSIVRTEAQRLRRKLHEYYQNEGDSDSVLISFESGGYVPEFRRRPSKVPADNDRPEFVSIGTHKPAIAVLPLSNLSADAEQEYFCQGIAESIQERLAASAALKVISPLSAFRFASIERNLNRLGRGLRVDTIVQGSLRQFEGRVRVHVKAIDVASEACIWAQRFDRDIRDLFAIEDEIAWAVTKALTDQQSAEPAVPESPAPGSEAYRLYLRGRHLWNKLTVDGCQEASKFFVRAISIEPDYAQAYAALADDYHWLIFFGVRNPDQLAHVTRRLSLKALLLDRNCAEAYVSLATQTAVFEWQWGDAEVLFRRGLELRPNYVLGYVLRAFCRLQAGDLEGSRSDVEKTLDLDPLSPRSHRAAGIRLYILRDYQGAISAFDRALELGPEIKSTHYYRGLALLGAERYDDAAVAINDSLEPSTAGAHLGALVAAYAAGRRKQKANETFRRLHELSSRSFVPPISFGFAYAGLGRKAEALDWIERAVNERSAFTIVTLTPFLEDLRGEPRFQPLLRRMNLS